MDYAEIFYDAFIDSLKMLPILAVVYVVMEILERTAFSGVRADRLLKGKFAPLIGAGVGIVPQCGFSVVATDLFSRKKIGAGTLIAVYIATSDEAIPILLSNPDQALKVLPFIGIKFVLAIFAGYGIDLFLRFVNGKKEKEQVLESADEKESVVTSCEHCAHESEQPKNKDMTKAEKTKDAIVHYFVHPLIHSLKIFIYIWLVSTAIALIVAYVGEEALIEFMQGGFYAQPFLAALIGLIPNCASSVLITQLYIMGGLNAGAAIAGLCVNAGVAITVLFKSNRNLKVNISIVAFLYVFSSLMGLALSFIPN